MEIRIKRSNHISHAGEERSNHKYIARVPVKKVNGVQMYKYFYDEEEYRTYLKRHESNQVKPDGKTILESIKNKATAIGENTKKKTDEFLKRAGLAVEDRVSKIPGAIDKVVNKAKEIGGDLYDFEDNIYDVNPYNYDDKIKKIAETEEWKAIVENKDPEYVKKNADGTETYLIDDYLAKKKNPVLDILDDIISNRTVTVNKVDKDALVAGAKSKIYGTISIGIMAAGVATKVLIERAKLTQGSYNEEVQQLMENMVNGRDYVNRTIETASTAAKAIKDEDAVELLHLLQNTNESKSLNTSNERDYVSELVETVDRVKSQIDTEAVKQTVERTANSSIVNDAAHIKNAIDQDNVIEAARILLNSSSIPESVSDSEYYKNAERVLSSLSQEEIALVNALISGVVHKL